MSLLWQATAAMELTRQQKVLTFIGTLLGVLLGALDQTIVSTALPTIQTQLHIEPALYVWVTTSYMLGSTVLVPVWGKLSDLYGRKPIMLIGIATFLLGSIACGASQTTLQLIAARVVQGVGSASLFTTAFAIVADLFSPAERGKYSGVIGAVFGLSSLVGPLLGGFITEHFGWHWVFFINVPVGIVAFAFIFSKMPWLKRVHDKPPRVDWVGALLLAGGAVPVLLGITFSRGGGLDQQTLALFGGGIVGVALFIWWERGREQPLIQLELFKLRIFAVGNATVFVFGAVFLSPIMFLPLYLMKVLNMPQSKVGLAMMPLVLGILVGNIGSGQVASRLGRYKGAMVVGLGILITGLAVMAFTLRVDSSLSEVTWKMVLVGLGLGPSIPLYTVAIQNAVPPQQLGSVTGVATFLRQLGGTLGIAVAGAVYAVSLTVAPLDAADVTARFVGARALTARALDGDVQAQGQLKQASWADDAMRALFDGGGPRARVKTIFTNTGRAFDENEQRAEDTAAQQAQAVLEQRIAAAEAVELDRYRYTHAIRAVYELALILTVLAMLLTLALPSLPLKGRGEKAAAVPAEG